MTEKGGETNYVFTGHLEECVCVCGGESSSSDEDLVLIVLSKEEEALGAPTSTK